MSSMALKLINLLILTLYITTKVSGQCAMPYKYGPDCRYDCNCILGETCDNDRRCTTCRAGWDGPTCQRRNVALGRPTNQSSTYVNPFNGNIYPPSVAVDGKVGNNLTLPCTHTDNNTPATWEVTLDKTYTISRFRIYNRAETFGHRLNGFVVSVWPSSGPYSTCYTDNTQLPSGPGDIIYKECQDGATGNRVQIHIASGYLALCEVLLYACSNGTYGEECEHYCGECRDTYVCNKKTGVCPDTGGDLCKPGFSGDKCNECISGRYGDTCQLTCGQCQNIACDRQTGNCASCKTGYMMPLCQECNPDRYGDACQHTCGQCQNTVCNKQNGECPTCKPDYKMPLCQECNPGRYGDACQHTCGQCQNTVCNKQTGECPICKPGYMMSLCQDCVDSRWGKDCSSLCGKCFNGTYCAKVTGDCHGTPRCAAGYKGNHCNKGCDDGDWGEDCVNKCGHCRIFPCDKENGVCLIQDGGSVCQDGYTGAQCTKRNCSQNTYGPGCIYICHCADDTLCDPILGCNGKCAVNWDGPACQRWNVAQGSTTSQSSTLPYEPELSSNSAVDGKIGHLLSLPCSHTNDDDQSPSWTVTLNQTYNIYRFRIYNRGEGNLGNRLNGFSLSVGPSLCYQDNTTSESGPGDIIDGTCQNRSPISGIAVRIQAPKVVCLCEVLLYVCSSNWYGDACQRECTTSDRCLRCDLTGVYCEECFTGQWSEHCDFRCGNCMSEKCVQATGECPFVGNTRCKAGYKGANCTTACSPGTHGSDCAEKCGFCADGPKACDHKFGACPLIPGQSPCMDGYTGVGCKTEATANVGIIVGSIAGAVVLVLIAIIVGLLILYMRRSRGHQQEEHLSDVGEVSTPPTPLHDIKMNTVGSGIDPQGRGVDPQGRGVDPQIEQDLDNKEEVEYESIAREYENIRDSRGESQLNYSQLT